MKDYPKEGSQCIENEIVLMDGWMKALTGCTIHFVTDEVDCGPVFIQKKCSVKPEDTVKSLKRKVQKLEGEAFLEAIPLFETKHMLKHE